MRVAGLILAGGRSRRMGGGDKFMLELDGRPLITRVVERLRSQVEFLAISANGDPERLRNFSLKVLPDETPSRGPLSGLRAGLDWAQSIGATHLVTAAADSPFLPPDLVQALCAGMNDKHCALAASGGRTHPTFGAWRTDVLSELDAFFGEQTADRVLDFARRCGAAIVDFASGSDGDPFFNVNTPEDLQTAQALISGRG